MRSLVSRTLCAIGLSLVGACSDGARPPEVKRLEAPRTASAALPETMPAAMAPPDAGGVAVTSPPDAAAAATTATMPDEPPVLTLPPTFDARMQLGRRLARQGKREEAISAYMGALALQPASERPHLEMARLLLEGGDPRSARLHADQAIGLAPTSSSAWNTKGRVLFVEKEYDAAAYAFTKATEHNGENHYAWNNLGLVLMAQSKWDDAILALETATGLPDPETYMWINLGTAYERANRLVDARGAYRHGLARGSADARKALLRLDEAKAGVGPATTPL
jgi:tetratricopeptide (TPR) repeat protein